MSDPHPSSPPPEPAPAPVPAAEDLAAPLDPAQQSLAEALKVSFGILTVAMYGLLVA